MTDYAWPSMVDPAAASLTWKDNTVSFTSPLSGTTRTESRPGGKWRQTITAQKLKSKTGVNDPLHELESFLFKLNGAENRAIIPDFAYSRSGPGGGSTPRVYLSGQTGLSLNTYNWGVGGVETTVLYAGDRIGVNNQMLVVAADVVASISGYATITLAHPLRAGALADEDIEIDNPTARYILVNKPSFAAEGGLFKTVMVEFEEAIP